MNNLVLAFSVVFPLFCMMALGYGLTAVKLFNPDFLKQLNNLSFKVFLPLVLFVNIYNSDFKAMFSPKLLAFAIGSVLLCFVVLMILVPWLEKDNRKRGVIIQGILRSNYILFGIPIAASLYGTENTSVTAILIAFVVPLFNVLSVIALESFSDKKSGVSAIAKGVATNPLVLAAACAFFFILTGLRLPSLVVSTLGDIAKVATPLALIVLGGSFEFSNLNKFVVPLACTVLGKLVLLPAIFVPLGILAGFRGMELAALMAMFSSPTAVSTYTMAQNVGAEDILAGQIVVVDSLLSVLSIFVWITLLRQIGFI